MLFSLIQWGLVARDLPLLDLVGKLVEGGVITFNFIGQGRMSYQFEQVFHSVIDLATCIACKESSIATSATSLHSAPWLPAVHCHGESEAVLYGLA